MSNLQCAVIALADENYSVLLIFYLITDYRKIESMLFVIFE